MPRRESFIHGKVPRRIGIAGAGSFGTAIANAVARAVPVGIEVLLWSFDKAQVRALQQMHRNDSFLPGIALERRLSFTAEFAEVAKSDLLFNATPSFAIEEMALRLSDAGGDGTIISCTKGLRRGHGGEVQRMSEVLSSALPGRDIAVLSGPSHAEELAAGAPTAIVVACESPSALESVVQALRQPNLAVATSDDRAGVELGGALKNCYALAAGLCDGLGYATDTKAAVICGSLVELARLGEHLGGRRETFYGLSGLGDLLTTCFSPFGRNRQVGERLGRGETWREIASSMLMVAEGVEVTRLLEEWRSTSVAFSTPILDALYGLLFREGTPQRVIEAAFEEGHKRPFF